MHAPSQSLNSFSPEQLAEYEALRQKVDDFAAQVTARRAADLSCRAGCAACCAVELSVSAVEAAAISNYFGALSIEARAELGRALRTARHAQNQPETPRCVMLRDDNTCAIYPVRPLVCRSQGLPLLYPQELVPEPAQCGLGADGRALTFCPLNFGDKARPPAREDILDAERVDVLLSLVNRRATQGTHTPSLARYALADLAREFVE